MTPQEIVEKFSEIIIKYGEFKEKEMNLNKEYLEKNKL
jgi:hypothetical protein